MELTDELDGARKRISKALHLDALKGLSGGGGEGTATAGLGDCLSDGAGALLHVQRRVGRIKRDARCPDLGRGHGRASVFHWAVKEA